MQIRIDSITLYATYCTINAYLLSETNLPLSAMNFNRPLADAYDKVYEPGREYDFALTPLPRAGEPQPATGGEDVPVNNQEVRPAE